ncbi:hypothetical protein [Glacieibacterium sp.]|uniref:hypothetical protein n=1 Tax=Glacieibacterium sp. TaxID=2860237 RepID=UPI003B00C288
MERQDEALKQFADLPDLSVYRLARGRRSIAGYVSRVFGMRSLLTPPANDRK